MTAEVRIAECWCVHYCYTNGDAGCAENCQPHPECPSCVDPFYANNHLCNVVDVEGQPPCSVDVEYVDDNGTGYCHGHKYIAAQSNVLVYPNGASFAERKSTEEAFNRLASRLASALAGEAGEEVPF
jgi:hypothetical protein